MKNQNILVHIASKKHKSNKEKLKSSAAREEDNAKSLAKYDEQQHPKGETLQMGTRAFRVTVVQTFLKSGTPIERLEYFRELFENTGFYGGPYLSHPNIKQKQIYKISNKKQSTKHISKSPMTIPKVQTIVQSAKHISESKTHFKVQNTFQNSRNTFQSAKHISEFSKHISKCKTHFRILETHSSQAFCSQIRRKLPGYQAFRFFRHVLLNMWTRIFGYVSLYVFARNAGLQGLHPLNLFTIHFN